MPLLALEHVHVAFGAVAVLEDVSLTVGAGEVVALVGPNGAGKTTLLRVAGGLVAPTRGTVALAGQPLASLGRREAARRIAAVPAEEESVFPFTVRETVTLGRHPWRTRFGALGPEEHTRIEDLLASTGLADIAGRTLPCLSSGERQRVAIARCLAQDAALFLLDEPTAHLDLGHRRRCLEPFRAATRAGTHGVLAVLHDLNLAAKFADRVALLVGGRLVETGPPAAVFTADTLRSAYGPEVDILTDPRDGGPWVVARGDEG